MKYGGQSYFYAPSYARGTKRWRRYIRREPHNAIACDSMCDVHSGRRDRQRSRALKHRVTAHEIASGIELLAIERCPEVFA